MPKISPICQEVIDTQFRVASQRFQLRFAFILESLILLQLEQLLVKESVKNRTEFHVNYFSEEADPKYEADYRPSAAVAELSLYLRDFAAKMSQTMVQSKGKHFSSYNLSDIDD